MIFSMRAVRRLSLRHRGSLGEAVAIRRFGWTMKRFITQMSGWRRAAIVGLATVLLLAVGLNFTGHWWERHAFVANIVADLLLLGLAALLVDEYVSYLAAERWAVVAGFAMEDLGRVS